MKKIIFTLSIFLLSAVALHAQKLVITEVDAAENSYFDKAATQTLGKKMDLSLSGNTLSVKIGNEPEVVLTQLSDQYYQTERKTKDGVEKFSIKLKTINSVITTAEFTGTIIPNGEEQKKVWWTVTARSSDVVSLVYNL
jgi:hypothetical protein